MSHWVACMGRGFCACLAVSLLGSCILADSPSELPALPAYRPTIVEGSVVPSARAVLGTFPKVFVVPVQLVDPTAQFYYATFVDFDPTASDVRPIPSASGVSRPGGSDVDREDARRGLRTLELVVPPPPDLENCHVIEVLVARQFSGQVEGRASHAVAEDALDGDQVIWFYSPTGDLAGCPVQDASNLPPAVDAGTSDAP